MEGKMRILYTNIDGKVERWECKNWDDLMRKLRIIVLLADYQSSLALLWRWVVSGRTVTRIVSSSRSSRTRVGSK